MTFKLCLTIYSMLQHRKPYCDSLQNRYLITQFSKHIIIYHVLEFYLLWNYTRAACILITDTHKRNEAETSQKFIYDMIAGCFRFTLNWRASSRRSASLAEHLERMQRKLEQYSGPTASGCEPQLKFLRPWCQGSAPIGQAWLKGWGPT